ncbi:hypothetical protein CUJ83_08740 [Methanocella sp. CWC-04]|uniref:Methyltransferase type 11 domain-containing protein n=1 Tax=Methanooceanicella nereidis TaxID=2052831 RepID=A0AAP2RCV4_9EURY|nr:methyltransferase domain-containing protein [Methanocella sp. CWC-04]MCD1295083.1 hypothetical protein [Methanocella sp. CWC-04]
MMPDTVSLLCDPDTYEPLELTTIRGAGKVKEALVNPVSGKIFPIRDGIPIFVEDHEISGLNKKLRRFYDRYAPFYDIAIKLYGFLNRKNFNEVRKEYLKNLGIKGGDKVLEVSIGTGANIRYLPETCRFYGLDLSWGMLMKCRRNMKKWGLRSELFLGNAERLPFMDGSFDSVFHVGGINFFNDRTKAISEMIRVAKPGTKILIADESKKAMEAVSKNVVWSSIFKDLGQLEERAEVPVDLVPGEMQDVKVEYMMDGNFYCLYFRKPG